MKPLRNLVLIKQENNYKEEKTDSGIFLVTGDAANYNFKTDEYNRQDIAHRDVHGKRELVNKLLDHNKKKHGKHYDFHPGGGDVKLKELETNDRLKDLIYGRKGNSGTIQATGNECYHFSENDSVIFKRNAQYQYDLSSIGKDLAIVEEKDILVKNTSSGYAVHPDYIIVKISKESREDIFKRKFKRDNGEEGFLFIPAPNNKSDDNHSQFFVTCGEVYGVGENVKNVLKGDVAILSYLCDNNEDIIIGYDGEDKLIVVTAITSRYTTTEVAYANQRSPRDQIIHKAGDYNEMSELLGVIRGNELLARDPYVFLNHESTIVGKETRSGIQYKEDEKIIKRQVLAASEESQKRCNLKAGDWVIMDDFDVFSIKLEDRTISAINDIDIICPAETIDQIKENILVLKES